jgi:hypothetical protein
MARMLLTILNHVLVLPPIFLKVSAIHGASQKDDDWHASLRYASIPTLGR